MEIVVLDKVLQIDNGVWFFILFSVYLRVVRSLELQLFNYYLQWYSDTRGNFLQFTNLHDLVALGNHLKYMAWKEHSGYFYRNAFTSLRIQELPQHIWDPKKQSCFLQTLAQKPSHHEPWCRCSLPVLSLADLCHPDSQSCAGAFVSVAPKSWPDVFGELKGASDLAGGCLASFSKADSGNRKKGKHSALLMQYSI